MAAHSWRQCALTRMVRKLRLALHNAQVQRAVEDSCARRCRWKCSRNAWDTWRRLIKLGALPNVRVRACSWNRALLHWIVLNLRRVLLTLHLHQRSVSKEIAARECAVLWWTADMLHCAVSNWRLVAKVEKLRARTLRRERYMSVDRALVLWRETCVTMTQQRNLRSVAMATARCRQQQRAWRLWREGTAEVKRFDPLLMIHVAPDTALCC